MTATATTARTISVADLIGGPTFVRLPDPSVLRPCDGHAHGMVPAVVEVELPLGGKPSQLDLCGHCARLLGYDHTRER